MLGNRRRDRQQPLHPEAHRQRGGRRGGRCRRGGKVRPVLEGVRGPLPLPVAPVLIVAVAPAVTPVVPVVPAIRAAVRGPARETGCLGRGGGGGRLQGTGACLRRSRSRSGLYPLLRSRGDLDLDLERLRRIPPAAIYQQVGGSQGSKEDRAPLRMPIDRFTTLLFVRSIRNDTIGESRPKTLFAPRTALLPFYVAIGL